MAKVAETIVEEWLNRQGYFTIRGLKSERGGKELDLLAYRPTDNDAIHVEVQASPEPAGYLGANSIGKIPEGVREYVAGKYDHREVQAVRAAICPGVEKWRRMLVYHTLKREAQQVNLLWKQQVEPVRLAEILEQLRGQGMPFKTDSDASHLELPPIGYGRRRGRPSQR